MLRGIILRIAQREARRQPSPFLNDRLIRLSRAPSVMAVLALALYAGADYANLPPHASRRIFQSVYVLFLASVTLLAANGASAIIQSLIAAQSPQSRASGLTVVVVKGSILAIGFLIILAFLGISIAPMLTALGVGGLAVALALKDTLENLFAGVYLLTDKTIRVGDAVRLESGQEGVVEDIGWRTTRITTGNANAVILPNSRLAQSIVTNYSLPEPRLASSVKVTIPLEADAEQVEHLLLAVAKSSTGDVAGLLATPEPVARVGVGPTELTLDVTLYFHVARFSDQSFVQHELRKRIYRRLKESGVPLPQPTYLPRPSV